MEHHTSPAAALLADAGRVGWWNTSKRQRWIWRHGMGRGDVMAFDVLKWLEGRQVDFPTDRQPVSGLMAAQDVAVIDGKFYNLGEYPVPLARLVALGYELPEVIPPARVFPLFLHDVRCTAEGFEGDLCFPATGVIDGTQTLWHPPSGVSGVRLVGWADWLRDGGMFCVGLRGLDALRALICFRAWAASLNAARVVEWHRDSGGELSDYVALSPDVAGQPALLAYSADLGLRGATPRGRGKRGRSQKGRGGVDVRRAVIELAALAGLIRETDGLSSWDAAYAAACAARPKWVPATWGDPVARLEREFGKLAGTRWANVRNAA